MDARVATLTDSMEAPHTSWIRRHPADIVTLVLGSALALRFWFLFFGIADRRLMAVFVALAACEVAKRLVTSYRASERPRLFCTELRSDLLAALALGTAPWPITIPVNAATPLWTIAQAGWIGPIAVGVALVVSIRRLLFS